MQVAIVGDAKSGQEAVCDLLLRLGYRVGSNSSQGKLHISSGVNQLSLVNRVLFNKLGGKEDLPPQLPANWADDPSLDSLYKRAGALTELIGSQASSWAWSDTDAYITIPFWRRALPDLKFVVCVRNPLDVIDRIGYESSAERSFAYAKWHWIYLNILASTNTEDRIIISYDLLTGPSHNPEMIRFFRPDGMPNAEINAIPRIAGDGISSSIQTLMHDNDIHEACRRLYIGLISGSDNPDVARQIETSEVLLSVLYPTLKRASAYHQVTGKCSDLERQINDMRRLEYITSHFGPAMITRAAKKAWRTISPAQATAEQKQIKPQAQLNLEPVATESENPRSTLDRRPNASRLIVCAGHQRSGSTWLFNIIRGAHILGGYKTYGAWVETYDPTIAADVHVVKTHDYYDDLRRYADFIAVSKRDLRDCAASIIRQRWIGSSPEELASTIRVVVTKSILPWRNLADVTVAFEDISRDKISTIKRILTKLGLVDVDANELHRWVENMGKEVCAGINPITQFHPTHVTDGGVHTYESTLTKAQLAAVMDVCAQFENETLLVSDEEEAPTLELLPRFGYAGTTKAERVALGISRPLPRNSAQASAAHNGYEPFDRDSFAVRDESNQAPRID